MIFTVTQRVYCEGFDAISDPSFTKIVTHEYPSHQFAWKVLGAIFGKTARNSEALHAKQTAVALSTQDADARYNLGNTLRHLRKYEEAIHHFDLVNTDGAIAQSLECLYMNKNYAEFDKRLYSLSAAGHMNLRVAAVSSFVAHQMKKKDPYPFCTNPLDFISINNNLASYEPYSSTLLDEIIKEADGYQLT